MRAVVSFAVALVVPSSRPIRPASAVPQVRQEAVVWLVVFPSRFVVNGRAIFRPEQRPPSSERVKTPTSNFGVRIFEF